MPLEVSFEKFYQNIYVTYILYSFTYIALPPPKICHHSAFRGDVREIVPEYVRIYVNYLLYTSSYGDIALYL